MNASTDKDLERLTEELDKQMWLKYGQTCLTGLRSLSAKDAVIVIKNVLYQRPDVADEIKKVFTQGT